MCRHLRVLASAILDNDLSSDVDQALLELLDFSEYITECERCGDRCSPDDTRPVDDSDQWCESCCDSHAYYWESDSSWHTEEEEEEEEDVIPDYHDTDVTIPSDVLDDPTVLGIEVETYQRDCGAAADFLGAIRSATDDGLKFERDGSLDDEHGVEIVCRPYTLTEIRTGSAPWKKVLEWCSAHSAKAWDAGDGYGTHISINGAALQPLHRARIVQFINENQELCEEIAGRSELKWARYAKKGRCLTGLLPTGATGNTDFSSPVAAAKDSCKYLAAANRGSRIEIRIFRASLNWDRFVRNCEFVDAVRVYCADCGNCALSADQFKAWVRLPANSASYPELSKFYFPRNARKGAVAA